MSCFDELDKLKKESSDLLRWISNIVVNLSDNEISLLDIIAEEESLENRCFELQELMKKIVELRMWIDFEELGNTLL